MTSHKINLLLKRNDQQEKFRLLCRRKFYIGIFRMFQVKAKCRVTNHVSEFFLFCQRLQEFKKKTSMHGVLSTPIYLLLQPL